MAIETLTVQAQRTPRASKRPADARLLRFAPSAFGVVGAGIAVYGVWLPWLTPTHGGFLSGSAVGTGDGKVLLAAAAVAAVLAMGQLRWTAVGLRWGVALAGFGVTAYAGHVLGQLLVHAASGEVSTVTFMATGPGVFVATTGGLVMLFTILLPMPSGTATGSALSRVSSARLRIPAAALSLVAGLAHIPVTPAHLDEAPYIGLLFLLVTIAFVLGTAALLVSDSLLVWLGVAVASALAVLAYVESRTVGMPMMADDVGNWLEPLGVLSMTTESLVVVLAVIRLRQPRAVAVQAD